MTLGKEILLKIVSMLVSLIKSNLADRILNLKQSMGVIMIKIMRQQGILWQPVAQSGGHSRRHGC